MAGDSFQYNIDVNLKTESAQRQFDKLWSQARAGSEEAKDAINNILGGTKTQKISLELDNNLGKYKAKIIQLRSEYDKLDKVIEKKNRTEEGSVTSLRQQVNTAKQQRDAIAKTVQILNSKGQRITVVNAKWSEANNKVKQYSIELAKANGDMLALAKLKVPGLDGLLKGGAALNQIVMVGTAVVTTFQAIKGAVDPLINRVKQIEGLSLSMQGFGLSAKESEQVLMASKQIAFEYGASLGTIEKGFKRITPAILQSGGSLKDSSDVMAALSARTTTLGLNSEQSGRYIEAFAQVMGKGKLQSEELNQQFSELDGALRGQIAGYLKSTHGIDDLDKAMQNGEVTADLFREAFVAVSEEMTGNLKGAIGEVQQRMDSLNANQVQNIVNNLNTLTMESLIETLSGIGKSFQRIWVGATQFMASIANDLPAIQAEFKEFFDVLGMIADLFVRGILVVAKLVLKAIDQLVLGFRALGDAILNLPGVPDAFKALNKLGGTLFRAFNEGFDMIMNTGDAVKQVTQELSRLDGRMLLLKNQQEQGKITQEEYNRQLAILQQEMAKSEDSLLIAGYNKQIEELEENMKLLKVEIGEAKQELSEAKGNFDEEKEKVDALRQAIKDRYAEEIESSKEKEEEIKTALDNEKETYKEVKEVMKGRYEDERSRVSSLFDEKLAMISAEIDALNKRTPAEERLRQLRKEELAQKASSADLSEKERLSAQASLERMLRQDKIQQLNIDKRNTEIQRVDALKASEDNYLKALDQEKQKFKELTNALNKKLEKQVENTRNLEEEQKEYDRILTDSLKTNQEMSVTLAEIPSLVDKQADAARGAAKSYGEAQNRVKDLQGQLTTAANEAARLKIKIDEVTEARRRQQAAAANSSTPSPRASGGPVSGGSKYTVNELGKEAFLSASGKLSMINAPTFGTWKAPSSGTVIPAHLTNQLDIPAGGVNINKAPGMRATGVVSRPASISHGDNISNQVTIQSSNPNQTANSVMVQLAKLKRVRYS